MMLPKLAVPIRSLLPSRRLTAILAAASAASGLAEAGALVLVAQAALALSSGSSSALVEVGPVSQDVALGSLLGVGAAILVVKLAIDAVVALTAARLATMVLVRTRKRTFAAFMAASWDVQSKDPEGFLQELSTTHVTQAAGAAITASTGLGALFNFLALVGSAFLVNAWAALAVLVVALLLFGVLLPVSRLAGRYANDQREANLSYVAAVSEAANIAREVRTFGVAPALTARLAAKTDRVARPYFRANLLSRALPDVYQSAALALILVTISMLHIFEVGGLVSLGAVVLLLVRALLYTRTLQFVVHTVVERAPYVAELEERIVRYSSSRDPVGGRDLEQVSTIEFVDVGFSYDGAHPALRDVTFAVRRGEAIGIVGPSGAGKSTIVHLLLRLRHPSSGTFLVNGEPAVDYSMESWFDQFAYVPQEPRLLDGTMLENIRFLREDVDDDHVEAAARLAQIHDEIAQFSEGYATGAGPRGGRLSGGQRQRICLARALATEPSVLVLDEPTSALDAASETLIQEALARMKGTVTMFIVAHRLSTLALCDRLMVLENGRLEDMGTPQELLRSNAYLANADALSHPGSG